MTSMRSSVGVGVALVVLWSAACTPPRTVEPGGACDADADCQDGPCVQPVGGGEARCARACDGNSSCENGLVCGVGVGTAGPVTACVPPVNNGRPATALCAQNGDCQSGACIQRICRELCRDHCDVGERCEPVTVDGAPLSGTLMTGQCVWTNAFDGVELGPIPANGMESVDIPFTVPDNLASFTIMLVDDEALRVSVTRLTSPDGTVLFNALDAEADVNPGTQYIGAAALLVPSSDVAQARPAPGTWTMRVGTFDPAIFDMLTAMAGSIEHVTVVFEPAADQGGNLDLAIHLAPMVGNAADAPDAGFTRDLLTRTRAYLEDGFDVNLAQVTFADLPDDANVVEDGNEVRALCRTRASGGTNGITVNVFVVDDISFTGGFAGGIPGLPGVYGTNGSGVVIEAQASGNQTGILLAHELGHFLGLRHTTELTGGRSDPIQDTPSCPPGSAVEDCPDYQNLMFPTFPGRNDLVVTSGQRGVVRGSPHLYDPMLPAACAGLPPAVDMIQTRFAQGVLEGTSVTQGSCGGDGAERVAVLRVPQGVSQVRLRLRMDGGRAALYARVNACDAAEAGCLVVEDGATGELVVNAAAGDVVAVMVDAMGGTAPRYTLRWQPFP